jgi:hypothetical protein
MKNNSTVAASLALVGALAICLATSGRTVAQPPAGPGGPGGPPPGAPGGPRRGFGRPPRPGEILPEMLQNRLNLSDTQKVQLAKLQKDVDTKLAKILTADQNKQLEEMKAHGPGGPRGPGRGPGPGGPGGPGGGPGGAPGN